MQAALNLDQYADIDTVPASLQSLIAFKSEGGNQVAYYPAGTLFEGALALQLCRTGQASPKDDECAAALGWSAEQVAAQAVEYRMTDLGIHSENDRKLYRAGVILGYDDKLAYIPGPNWEKYQAALAKTEEDE
jgi:hypothetical protein